MDHGRIVEHGTHRELLAAGGAYENMWALQQHEGDAAVEGPSPPAVVAVGS
jgi:ATP-binding cassette subfamily B protein